MHACHDIIWLLAKDKIAATILKKAPAHILDVTIVKYLELGLVHFCTLVVRAGHLQYFLIFSI